MKIHEIREMCNSVGFGDTWDAQSRVHESILRAYQILEKVKYLLAEGTPPKTILDLIAEMESGPNRTYLFKNE